MAFRRHVRDRRPRCGLYDCPNTATCLCQVCQHLVCDDCARGHVRRHARRMIEALSRC